MSVALDGRNEKDVEDPSMKFFAIAIRDDFNTSQKYQLIGARKSGYDDREGPVHFDDQKLKRFVNSGKYGKCKNVKNTCEKSKIKKIMKKLTHV